MYSQKWNCAASLFTKHNYYVLSPNFQIHASMSDLYIPMIGLPRTCRGNIKIAHIKMNVETGDAQFHFLEYMIWIFGTVCLLLLMLSNRGLKGLDRRRRNCWLLAVWFWLSDVSVSGRYLLLVFRCRVSVVKCWLLVVGCRCRWLLHLVPDFKCLLLIVGVDCRSLFPLPVPSSGKTLTHA